MGESALKRATYDDVIAAPEHLIAEVIDGVLYTRTRPATPHALAASAIGAELWSPFNRGRGGPGGWIILDEPELHLAGDILVPDLAGWRRERMPVVPRAPFIELAPDWVCEVLSPGTRTRDRTLKLPIYARERVAHAWLVDPLERSLEVLELHDGRWLILDVFAGDATVRARPFDAVALDLAVFWADLAPEPDAPDR